MSINHDDVLKPYANNALWVNTALLATHIALMFFFCIEKVSFMFYLNIGSVFFYLFCFILIKKRHITSYLFLIVMEITGHMIAALICLGWGSGFQLYSFGIVTAIYYTFYSYCSQKGLKEVTILGDALGILAFISMRIYTSIKPPLYILDDKLLIGLQIANGLVIFGFCIVSLHMFAKHAVSKEKDLSELAEYDELTKLFNRHKMKEILEFIHQDAERDKCGYCTAILDIDDFKQINDTYGHNMGDQVLAEVSKVIQQSVDSSEGFVCRWGGEEFLVVKMYDTSLDENLQQETCIEAAKKLHEAIGKVTISSGNKKVRITSTLGISFHRKSESLEETISRADKRLYIGKSKGKNQVVSES